MSLLQRACKLLGGLALVVAVPCMVYGQSTNTYAAFGSEYAPAGTLPGDQVHSALALNASGGFLVWQDNITDGDGLGISAVQLSSAFSPTYSNFRVNQNGASDQENPQVALLQNGGAVFVWQSGPASFQHIYARFRGSNGLWTTGDVMVNTDTNHYQVDPAITVLTNGNVVVVWGSFGEANPDGLQDVYGQILSPTGQKVGGEFLVNSQFTSYNQRNPAVAALTNGNFVVAWVSEMERFAPTFNPSSTDFSTNSPNYRSNSVANMSVDIYARLFSTSGTPTANEFLVNTTNYVCANPAIGTAPDGSFFIAWSQKDTVTIINSWDVMGRAFSSTGVGGTATYVNTQRYGNQYAPKISSVGMDYLVVWTSVGQDGSREGVFGQFVRKDGTHEGDEFRVNTTVMNSQMYPAVASDGVEQFLVSWSGYVGGLNSMDLYAQRYINTTQPLSPPGAPYVIALDSSSLSVTWPTVLGFNVSYYQLYVDGTSTNVTTNLWYFRKYAPTSTHTFQLAYVLSDGRVSPLSPIASGTTWDIDSYGNGVPDDWEELYFGLDPSKWPTGSTLLAPGVTVKNVFLWGANPHDPSTWLRQWISQTPEGLFLNWNTVPGGIYQVQTSADLKTWTAVGGPRFESGATDSIYLGLSSTGYYKVFRNRY